MNLTEPPGRFRSADARLHRHECRREIRADEGPRGFARVAVKPGRQIDGEDARMSPGRHGVHRLDRPPIDLPQLGPCQRSRGPLLVSLARADQRGATRSMFGRRCVWYLAVSGLYVPVFRHGTSAMSSALRTTHPAIGHICLLAVASLAATAVADVPPTADLPAIFNGSDLAGWKVVGEPSWKVVDGTIVGENDPEKKGSMLYTDKPYRDVIVEGEVRFTGEIDSGIMVRQPELQVQIGVSRSLKKDMTCSFYNGRYPEEARAPQAAELLKPGEWNRIRVKAKGDTFTVWLNGQQVSQYTSDKYREPAPIGLQIHAGLVMKVEFRDLRAKEL
jgi:hypothetical protein